MTKLEELKAARDAAEAAYDAARAAYADSAAAYAAAEDAYADARYAAEAELKKQEEKAMSDYRIEAATKDEWAERALKAEAYVVELEETLREERVAKWTLLETPWRNRALKAEAGLAKAITVVEMIASADVDAVLGQAVDLSCEIIGELIKDEDNG